LDLVKPSHLHLVKVRFTVALELKNKTEMTNNDEQSEIESINYA